MRKYGLLAAAACGLLVSTVALRAAAQIGPGQAAPRFHLADTDGEMHKLADLKGQAKAVVLIFVSSRCPVSESYNTRYKQLVEAFGAKGVVVWGINSNATETADDIKAHADSNSYNFPVLLDRGNQVADAYGARVTPEVFVLDSNLVVRYHGAFDSNMALSRVESGKHWAKQAVGAVLAQNAPDPDETKAFGCSIKRRR